MKETLLRYVLLAVFATVAVSGYGDDKVDYAKIETLVTNRLVILGKRVMVYNYLYSLKRQTGATDSDVADCLGRYIKRSASAEPGTKEYGRCRTAIWLFAEISDDRQMKVLADVAESNDSMAAERALSCYYRRMRDKGGLEFVEKLLDKDNLSTNMYGEISTVLLLDAGGCLGKDVNHRTRLAALARRQLSRRKHCRLFDEVLSSIDAEYAESEQRRQLVEDAASNRIRGMSDQHRKYFLAVKEAVEKRTEARK